MTVSPDSRPDDRYSNVTEGDVAQRPEEESSLSRALKVILVIGLIALGAIGIYVIFTLFSAGVQGPLEEPVREDGVQQPVQPAEGERNPPLQE